MAKITGKVYRLTDIAEVLFRTIFPDLDQDAKYILISPEGMMTFDEDPTPKPGMIRVPRFEILSYYEVEFETE